MKFFRGGREVGQLYVDVLLTRYRICSDMFDQIIGYLSKE